MNNKISILSVFEESWQILKDKILEMLVGGALLIIGGSLFSMLSMPVSFLRVMFEPGSQHQNTTIFFALLAVEVLLSVINALISIWLTAGVFNFFLKILRKEEYTYKDLFIFDMKKLLRILGFFVTLYILIFAYIAILAALIAVFAVMMNKASMPVSFMLALGILFAVALLPMLAACICVSQSLLLIIDGKDGVFSSITHSFSMMKSRILEFFLLMLASYFLYLLSLLLTCCIGIFISLPWLMMIMSIYYKRLIQAELPPPPPPNEEPKGLSNDEIPSAS